MKKPHKCNEYNEINIEKAENYYTEEALINQAKSIIKLNPLEPLAYHKMKLEEKNIL